MHRNTLIVKQREAIVYEFFNFLEYFGPILPV